VEEIHFRLELPVVQAGERPYESPDSGGHLFTQEGSAAIVATESVCVSMAVSSIQEMPSEGWPLIIVPPDIGDTYRTAVDRFGQLFSSLEHEGTATGAVVVSWEGPLHGERSASEHAPLARIHNYANPGAARGNVLQGVADLTELIRAASTLAWSAQESPTGEALSIDASRVALIGHGHGATLATLAAPVAPEVGLLVLSGAGADMMTTWLGQSDPVTTQLGAAVTLAELDADGPTELNRYHPALLRFGSFMNAVDPVNFAALLAKSPLTSTPRRHILNIHGIPDHTTSEGAARLYARRLGAPLVGDVLEEVSGLDAIEAPATETLGPEGAAVTAGTVQASAPDEASSHRVFFDDDAVRAQASGFVASWLTGNTPSIPARE